MTQIRNTHFFEFLFINVEPSKQSQNVRMIDS